MRDRPRGPQEQGRRQPKKERKESGRLGEASPKGIPIEGLAAICEYLRFRPSVLKEIWVSSEGEAAFKTVAAEIQSHGIIVHKTDRDTIARLWGLPQVYGPLVGLGQFKTLGEDEGLARLKKLGRDREIILVLDRIQDPRNLGAIIRSAAFFDVRHIFIPERRQVSLTPAVIATAQGGLAIADITVVTNLSRLLRQLKELGYWVLAADMGGKPIDASVHRLDRIALVLGSEGDGVSKILMDHADVIVGQPSLSGLESLNVSVAAGIFLAQLANLSFRC